MEFSNPWLGLLEEIADEADAIAMRFFQTSDLSIDAKYDGSPVSEADRAIERVARAMVSDRYPELGVFGEEEGDTPAGREGSGARLIIDPIDGTRNFVRGIPIFATLLAVEEHDDIVAGVVSAPALGSRWRAAKGLGAYEGARRLRVSDISAIERAQVFHGDLGGTTETPPPSGWSEIMRRVERSRGFGDFYQHMLVAQGAGELAVDPGVNPWDIAPILLIVEEAGGRATAFDGARTIYHGNLVTSNGLLHTAALDALAP